MQKKLLCVAMTAALAISVSAHATKRVTNDSTGSTLIYPYYSVMGGNQTFISLTNRGDEARAIKVRFREGVGSRDVLDFTLYLSPYDHWSAVLFRSGDEIIVNTSDSSCTVPDVGTNNAKFSVTRISDDYDAASKTDRVSEGHIEIISMYDLNDESEGAEIRNFDAGDDDNVAELGYLATHVNGMPRDCDAIRAFTAHVAGREFGNAGWNGPTSGSIKVGWDSDALVSDLGAIPGYDYVGINNDEDVDEELYGHAAIFNPADGTYYTYNAIGMGGWDDEDFEGPRWFPQNSTGLAELGPYTTDRGLAWDEGEAGDGLVEYFDLPDLSTPAIGPDMASIAYNYRGFQYDAADWNAYSGSFLFDGLDANGDNVADENEAAAAHRDSVTFALLRAALYNDYITSDGYETEWVITFPTRYLHVDIDQEEGAREAVPPFSVDENERTGEACHLVDWEYFDREEGHPTDPGSIDFSPGGTVPDTFQLCYETNVMAFNQSAGSSSAVLNSAAIAKYVGLESGYDNGWGNLGFEDHVMWDGPYNAEPQSPSDPYRFGSEIRGLPVAGFAAVSNSAGQVLRGATFKHHEEMAEGRPLEVAP